MAMVKVYNRNTYDHVEKFKGDEIKIKAGGFIEMEKYEAVEFMGQFKAPTRDGDNQPLKESFKMLEMVEHSPVHVAPASKFVHPLTGESFDTEAELNAALEMSKAKTIVDEEAEAEIKSRKRRAG